jgi:ribose transport system substrate-binding protein
MTPDCSRVRVLLRWSLLLALGLGLAWSVGACGGNSGSAGAGAGGSPRLTIGVAFETLQTEFWVAAWNALKARAAAKQMTLLEAVADGDASKQFDQVRTFVARRVDGIILVPKDGKTVIPMIRSANVAEIPIVLLNRPADRTGAPHAAGGEGGDPHR